MLKMFCRHTTVEVIRWHPNVITKEMIGKELYRDRYGVANFVRCVRCGAILNTRQGTLLYDTSTKEQPND